MTSRPVRIGVQIAAPARRLPADPRHASRELEELGVDILFNWDHFFPLYRRPRRPALRVVDDARRVGGADHPRRVRRPRQLQQLPQPRPAGRHGPHDRPHQRHDGRAAASSSAPVPAGSSATTTSTATSSAPPASGSMRSPIDLPRIEQRWEKLNPPPDAQDPRPDRRRGREEDPAHRRAARRHLAQLRRRG